MNGSTATRAIFEYTRPLPVAGGIAAHSRRGAIGETWWSQRFIALLESFGVGSRLPARSPLRARRPSDRTRRRGRRRHRQGAGLPLLALQGPDPRPKLLSDAVAAREKAMAAQALPLAKLLAGEMPHDIEDVFAALQAHAVPALYSADLKATCTCPDRENPCKHVAAVYYILAEHFDADPFLIFAWRGRRQHELLERLRAYGGARPRRDSNAVAPAKAAPQPTLLADQLDSFWSNGTALAELHVSPLAAEAPDSLLRQLGPAPVDVGSQNLIEILAPAYALMAGGAEQRALA